MRILLSLLLVALFGLTQSSMAADDFPKFWTQFKAAIKKRDKNALASMTKLPFLFDSKNLEKTQFIAKVDQILPAKLATCLEKEKPVLDNGSYSAFCGEQIYIFSKVNGKYLFTDIGVND